MVRIHTEGTFDDLVNLTCLICGSPYITPDIFVNELGGQDGISELKKQYLNPEVKKIECPVCYEYYEMDECITYDCNHRTCIACGQEYM